MIFQWSANAEYLFQLFPFGACSDYGALYHLLSGPIESEVCTDELSSGGGYPLLFTF